jgi:hypothetical protein
MEYVALVASRILAARRKQAADIVLAHRTRGERKARREGLALEAAAGDRNMHVLDGHAGHALGGIDGGADAGLGAVEMGDHAGLEALGAGVVEADHLELHGVAPTLEPIGRRLRLGDQAADLARADVKRGHDPLAFAPYRGRVTHPPFRPVRFCPWPALIWCLLSECRLAFRLAAWSLPPRASAP